MTVLESTDPAAAGGGESTGAAAGLIPPDPASPTNAPQPVEAVAAARRRAALNMLANIGGYGLTAVVAFFIWPLEVHKLGDQAYGLWALLQQLIGYAGLLDFGVRIAVLRGAARLQAVGDETGTERLISTSFFMMLMPAGLILLAGVGFSVWLPAKLGLTGALLEPARWATILASITVALAAPGTLFNGCVAAVSRYDLLNLRNASVQLTRGLLLWYLLTHGYGLVSVAAVFLLTEEIGQSLDLWFSWRNVRGLRVRWSQFDPAIVRELLNFGAYAFLISIAVRLVYWSDNVVVGFMAGAAAVTFYSVAGSLVQYLRDALTNFTSVLGPMIAQMDVLGEHDALRRTYRYASKVAVATIVPGVLFLVFEGHNFLFRWMGAEMADRSTATLILLALAALALPFGAMYSHVLYAMARHQFNGWMALAEAALNLGLSVVLIQHMGISGVALGTLLPAVLIQIVMLPVYTCRQVHISVWVYWGESLLRPLAAAVPVALALLWANHQGWTTSWLELFSTGVLLTLGYFAIAWFSVLAAGERRQLAGLLRARLRQSTARPLPGQGAA